MEERVQSPPIHNNQSHVSQLQLPNFESGTYVVQIPRDQIFRVPPPENAIIAEQHQNIPERNKRRRRCWCYVRVIFYIAIAALIGAILGGLTLMLNKPRNPRFSIQNFLFHNTTYPQYKITLEVYNPNSRTGILYKEGHASLLVSQREIASGAYPTSFQPHHSSKVVSLALEGSKTELPKVVHDSLKGDGKKVHVTFSLAIHVQAQMKLLELHGGTKNYDVTCQVTVDTLAKDTRVLSQQCQTQR